MELIGVLIGASAAILLLLGLCIYFRYRRAREEEELFNRKLATLRQFGEHMIDAQIEEAKRADRPVDADTMMQTVEIVTSAMDQLVEKK